MAVACTQRQLVPQLLSPDRYTAEDIFMVSTSGRVFSEDGTTPVIDGDTLIAYPYPNTSAPATIVSSDSNVLRITDIGCSRYAINCRIPGDAVLTASSCGVSKDFSISFSRNINYDVTYDAASDMMRLGFFLDGDDMELNPAVFYKEGLDLHICVRWSYTVGYSSTLVKERFPITSITEGIFPFAAKVDLGKLREQYYEVKALYDKEFEQEFSADPNHNWNYYSGIHCAIDIRYGLPRLKMERVKGDYSLENYVGDVDLDISAIIQPGIFK